jgi:hypothetical protein
VKQTRIYHHGQAPITKSIYYSPSYQCSKTICTTGDCAANGKEGRAEQNGPFPPKAIREKGPSEQGPHESSGENGRCNAALSKIARIVEIFEELGHGKNATLIA